MYHCYTISVPKGILHPAKKTPSAYIYNSSDLVQLSSHKFKQLCRTTHQSFQHLVNLIQDDTILHNSSRFKQRDPAIQLAVELEQLGSNGKTRNAIWS
ncbi:hypothetical protein O181_065894 [Austropuccinia psidii MF-1]|uniref:Uncharacterized protein n=1 Tax=Austropuccinia psidii MF-1 TaxID=1389203 RepID=A0A9Q3I501_9BASI|nr:hypothetical protein [Austropuccinia psidii MF-1]